MPHYDGAVIIKTLLDNSHFEKEYAKTVKKIDSLEREANAKRQRKASLEIDQTGIKEQLEAAQKKWFEMNTNKRNGLPFDGDISAQQAEVISLQNRWEENQKQIEAYEQQIRKASEAIEVHKIKAGGILESLNDMPPKVEAAAQKTSELKETAKDTAKETERVGKSFSGMKKRMDEISKQFMRMTTQMLAFSLLHSVLQSVQTYMGSVISTNDEASASLARLKGALLTMVQPLTSVVIPAFTVFANLLTAIIGKIAAFFALLGGSTVQNASRSAKALDEETKALKGAGAAAKKAGKDLAGFDEINRLSDPDVGGGGGGAATVEPDFSWADGVSENLSQIADYVFLIGVGFGLWKIGDMLPGVLGTIATNLGLILAILGGLLLMWWGLTDAWENGVDWGNMAAMILGLAAAAGALYLLMGPLAAGILLVVGGLALLATGFRDVMENGFNLQNTLLSIAGIIAIGLGITLLTGSLIPLLVAGILGLLTALTVATGNGEMLIEGIQEVCQGFVDFFTGIFSGDIEKTMGGIELMFSGASKVIQSVIMGIRDTFLSFLDWLDEKTGGKLTWIIDAIRDLFVTGFDWILESADNLMGDLEQIFSGLIEFIMGVFTGDWDRAWNGLKDVFKGICNGIISTMEGAMNLVVDGINWVVRQINKIRITIPDWVPGIGGSYFGPNITPLSRYSLPRLAQGAVIPPNREFLAVLGDQTHGTNVEAPLSTIQEAVAVVMEDMIQGQMAGFEAVVEVLREILEAIYGIEIGDEVISKAARRYQEKLAIAKGR